MHGLSFLGKDLTYGGLCQSYGGLVRFGAVNAPFMRYKSRLVSLGCKWTYATIPCTLPY